MSLIQCSLVEDSESGGAEATKTESES